MPLLKSKSANQNAATTNRSQPIPTQIQNQSVVLDLSATRATCYFNDEEQLESKIKEVKSGIKFGAIQKVLGKTKNKTTAHRN
jgi:hypothetical protein